MGIVTAVLLAVVGVLWLSGSMETLDRVAELLGVKGLTLWNPLFPDYILPGHEGNVEATLVLGVTSTLIVFGAAYLLGRLLIAKRRKG